MLLAEPLSRGTLERTGDDPAASQRDLLVDKFVARTTTASGVSHYLEDATVIEQIAESLR